MNSGPKTFIKLIFGIAAVVTASWFLIARTERILHNNPSTNRVWFYDENENKLYAMPDTTIPPDKASGEGDRAFVVEFGGHEQKIAYLMRYTPELKETLEKIVQARAAGKAYEGKVPARDSAYFQTNTLVRALDEADWHPADTREGQHIIEAWRSWRGTDGSSARLSSPD